VDPDLAFQDILNKGAVDSVEGLAVELQVADNAGVGIQKHEVFGEIPSKAAPTRLSTSSVRCPEEHNELRSLAKKLGLVDTLENVY
jgi:hypothetical protein